jgi:protein-S-isoprenylcysteine O-methyltransferase Ste14
MKSWTYRNDEFSVVPRTRRRLAVSGHGPMNAVRFRQIAQRLRVPLGFVIVPLFLVFAEPTWASVAAGAAVALAGAGLRAWASGHLRKMAELTTSGPYAHTRNPLYLGTFIMVAGISLAAGQWWLMVLVGGAFLLVYVPVMLAEVDTMRALFPEAYDRWAAEVPLLVPRLTPARRGVVAGSPDTARARFDGRLYVRHREYRAVAGLVGVLGVLVAKLVLRG